MQRCSKWYLFGSTFILVASLILFFTCYELYPRSGWVDPAIYTGYILNPHLYRQYDVDGWLYQGSRLGFIMPAMALTQLFGAMNGRLIFTLGLYLLYLLSLFVIGRQLLRSVPLQLTVPLFILHPMSMAGIFYGHADGPAQTYMFAAVACLLLAFKDGPPRRQRIWACLGGLFMIFSLWSQIFMAATVLLLFPVLFVLFGYAKPLKREATLVAILLMVFLAVSLKNLRLFILLCLASPLLFRVHAAIRARTGHFILLLRTRKDRSLVTFFLCSAVVTAGVLSLGANFAHMKFYFWTNFFWTKQSLKGSGVSFHPPFDVWAQQALVWTPAFLAAVLALCIVKTRQAPEYRPQLTASRIFLLIPLIFCVLYDKVIGGNLLGVPSYYNYFFPAFVLGFILLLSVLAQPNSSQVLRLFAGIIAVVFLITPLLSPYVRSLYKGHDINSETLYQSQVEFVDSVKKSSVDTEPGHFIFFAAKPTDSRRVYTDFFNSKPRYSDYLDTLAGSVLWGASPKSDLNLRLDAENPVIPSDVTNKEFGAEPVLFLSRNRDELEREKAFVFSKLNSDNMQAQAVQCHDDEPYPWCYQRFTARTPDVICNPVN